MKGVSIHTPSMSSCFDGTMLVHSGPFMNDAILPTLASFIKWLIISSSVQLQHHLQEK
jgi:hypothetical protein